jgi:hypothetical protein
VVAEGYNARLVKRYRHGGGYQFVVFLAGFSDGEEARSVSKALARLVGVSVTVFEPPGAALVSDVVEGAATTSSPEFPEFDSLTSIYEQVRWVAERDDYKQALQTATQVNFRYRWTDSMGIEETHRYASQGNNEYYERVRFTGRSEIWLEDGQGWLTDPLGSSREVSHSFAAGIVRAASPGQVLGVGREFLSEILSVDLAPSLRWDGLSDVLGHLCYVLSGRLGPSRTPVSVSFDAKRYWMRQLIIGSSKSVWVVELDNYYEQVNGINVPHLIQVWLNGEILYTVNVEEISLLFDGSLGNSFIPPR